MIPILDTVTAKYILGDNNYAGDTPPSTFSAMKSEEHSTSRLYFGRIQFGVLSSHGRNAV